MTVTRWTSVIILYMYINFFVLYSPLLSYPYSLAKKFYTLYKFNGHVNVLLIPSCACIFTMCYVMMLLVSHVIALLWSPSYDVLVHFYESLEFLDACRKWEYYYSNGWEWQSRFWWCVLRMQRINPFWVILATFIEP